MKKQHAMKKIFVIAILGLAGLVFSVEQASAAGVILSRLRCCKRCSVKLNAKQYNAFSPYCLDSLSGCLPLGGLAGAPGCGFGGCGPACSYANMGELPAPQGFVTQGFAPQFGMPAEAVQGWSPWAPGMVNPNGMQVYPTAANVAPFPGAGR
jgi:hypothetical protein